MQDRDVIKKFIGIVVTHSMHLMVRRSVTKYFVVAGSALLTLLLINLI